MAQITIEYDAKDASAKKLLDAILSLPFFKIKETDTHYDKEFVAKIRRAEKSENWTAIETEDLWK